MNLTAVTGWREVQTRHFLDSLTPSVVVSIRVRHSGRVLDVGAGAGFPGVPLEIVFLCVALTLMDATAKKTAFLTHLAEALDLEGVEVVTGRAKTLAHDAAIRDGFHLVVSRGGGKLPVLTEVTLPFCGIGGIGVAQKEADVSEELERGARDIATLGGRVKEVRPVDLPLLGTPRSLIVLEKVAQTPGAYPRRPGVPKKRRL